MKTISINVSVPTGDDFRAAGRSMRSGIATGLTKIAKKVEPTKPKKKRRTKK